MCAQQPQPWPHYSPQSATIRCSGCSCSCPASSSRMRPGPRRTRCSSWCRCSPSCRWPRCSASRPSRCRPGAQGDAVGGLLNATLGNLTELVIALAALKAGRSMLVKASIAGAIVANSLFMLGMSFLLGGLKFHVQEFNRLSSRAPGEPAVPGDNRAPDSVGGQVGRCRTCRRRSSAERVEPRAVRPAHRRLRVRDGCSRSRRSKELFAAVGHGHDEGPPSRLPWRWSCWRWSRSRWRLSDSSLTSATVTVTTASRTSATAIGKGGPRRGRAPLRRTALCAS